MANELASKRRTQAATRTNLGRQIDDRHAWRREQLRLKAQAYDESNLNIAQFKADKERMHVEKQARVLVDRLDKERQIAEMRMQVGGCRRGGARRLRGLRF